MRHRKMMIQARRRQSKSCQMMVPVSLMESASCKTLNLININNNNNSSGFLYSAQVRHAVTLMVLQHYYPWSLGLKSFLKPSQLPGEYTACAAKYVATKLINHNTHLCPHRYPLTPGWREAIIVWSVLLRDTSVRTGIQTHTLLNRITGAWIRNSYPINITCGFWFSFTNLYLFI